QGLGDRAGRGGQRVCDVGGGRLQRVVHGAASSDHAAFGVVDRIGNRLGEHAHTAVDVVRTGGEAVSQRVHRAATFFERFQRVVAGGFESARGLGHADDFHIEFAKDVGELVDHAAD